jgi:hypothetical protein
LGRLTPRLFGGGVNVAAMIFAWSTVLHGRLTVTGAELGYTMVLAERDDLQRIGIARYASVVVDVPDKSGFETLLVNATPGRGVVYAFPTCHERQRLLARQRTRHPGSPHKGGTCRARHSSLCNGHYQPQLRFYDGR